MSEESAGEGETSQVVYGLCYSCFLFLCLLYFDVRSTNCSFTRSAVFFFLCKSLSLVLQDSAVSGSRKRKRVSRLFFSFLSQWLEG